MDTIIPILEKIRPLIAPLNAQERLTLIQAIAAIKPAYEPAVISSTNRQQQLAAEQATWYERPLTERQQYQGEFVALKDGQVIDHDPDQRTLYLQVKAQFGRVPVAILNADWLEPPTYTIHTPRLSNNFLQNQEIAEER